MLPIIECFDSTKFEIAFKEKYQLVLNEISGRNIDLTIRSIESDVPADVYFVKDHYYKPFKNTTNFFQVYVGNADLQDKFEQFAFGKYWQLERSLSLNIVENNLCFAKLAIKVGANEYIIAIDRHNLLRLGVIKDSQVPLVDRKQLLKNRMVPINGSLCFPKVPLHTISKIEAGTTISLEGIKLVLGESDFSGELIQEKDSIYFRVS